MIPYGRQDISSDDIDAVIAVLRSDYLTQGPAIEQFESAVADYCGVNYAVAVCNATAGLHLACLAAGVGAGDTVWTSPVTFVASANCALYCGATPDFVDVEPGTGSMSVSALKNKLQQVQAQKKPLPKAIIPVHLMGQSADMVAIHELANAYGIPVIEDAAHAIGGSYRQRKVGSCQFSEMTVFSFHPVKIITTGEGGMVLTNRKDLYDSLIRLRSHGITRDPKAMVAAHDGDANINPKKSVPAWYYQQIELGFNYRITDIQAALGSSQMHRIDAFIERREALATRYDELLANLPLDCPERRAQTNSAWHLYTIRLHVTQHREAVFNALRAADIGVNVHYIPVHTQPYYAQFGFQPGDFPAAEHYYAGAISLPLYYGLTDEQQDYVVRTLKETLEALT